jgi:4-aminobutyrate aminotransferase/(S)-3-amino-2-methylpropionate transaminase
MKTEEKISNNQNEDGFEAGPKSKEIFKYEQKYIAPGVQSIGLFSELVMERGEGANFIDVDGNKYIDMYGGVGVASLGHGHKGYAKAISEQVAKINTGSFATKQRRDYCKTISEVTPGNLNRTQLYSSGAEAVEAAIRLAKSYTKNNEIVGFWGGFHGKTGTVIGLLDTFKREMGPIMSGVHSVPYAYCYQCPFKMKLATCNLFCADYIKKALKQASAGKIAAFLIEPIHGTNGNVVPPPGFLKAVKERAKEEGALVIADEMITGFGRTGKMFAVEHEDFMPDIITVGKGMGNGFPVSGLISSDEVINAKPFSNPSGSSSSYGGNPLASTAVNTTLNTIIEDNLVEHSKTLGEFMMNKLRTMQEKYRFIGDVRGRGMMIGVELVKDRDTRENLDKHITRALFDECLKRGVMSMCYSHSIRINPPLVITKEEAEKALNILDESFGVIAKKFNIN